MKLSSDQEAAVQALERWYEQRPKSEIRLGGLAGTGKTTIAACLPGRLGLGSSEVAYCAYAGKAARVLTAKLSGAAATTIHGLIYKPHEEHCERCPTARNEEKPCHDKTWKQRCCKVVYGLAPYLDPPKNLIICDESSMVGEAIYDDLLSFGVPIIWIGDHGQLGPIDDDDFSLMAKPDIRLEVIHRQAEESPILQAAYRAREGKAVKDGHYGPGLRGWRPLRALTFDTKGLILCATNRTRVQVNAEIRERLGCPEQPIKGDRVICLRNNRERGIFNGMRGTIEEIKDCGGKSYEVEIWMDDNEKSYQGWISKEQFGYHTTLGGVRGVDLFDFGYCLTVHKAQGSEADHVLLLHEGWPKDRAERRRWLYTGITRAKQKLTIVPAGLAQVRVQ